MENHFDISHLLLCVACIITRYLEVLTFTRTSISCKSILTPVVVRSFRVIARGVHVTIVTFLCTFAHICEKHNFETFSFRPKILKKVIYLYNYDVWLLEANLCSKSTNHCHYRSKYTRCGIGKSVTQSAESILFGHIIHDFVRKCIDHSNLL